MPSVIYDPIGLARGAGGGALIGLAATALWALTGQTLGVSGIVGGIVRDGNAGHNAWRLGGPASRRSWPTATTNTTHARTSSA